MRDTPFSEPRSRFLAGKFGVGLFLVSLSVLFAASLVGFFVIRYQLGNVWPDLPPLPRALWISTIVLISSSVTMQWALNGVRAGRLDQLRIGMPLTTMLGFLFLVVQTACWLTWLEPVAQLWGESDEYRFALVGFYLLTGLHALHVVGGLIPMSIVTRAALASEYSREFHSPVQYCAMYWHFLGVVWIVLLIALKLGT